ncbi:hypothetical protein EVAR_19620_1 [Eumeta japonica]|uniref:Uncharacterized protein n=1 Tax=Eumeta variegata TaxID=151549 RepID=A0A4C1UFF7_EUMVA|nr:hypothetical protein EVAR_19620_1 [Eumeta japonica]
MGTVSSSGNENLAGRRRGSGSCYLCVSAAFASSAYYMESAGVRAGVRISRDVKKHQIYAYLQTVCSRLKNLVSPSSPVDALFTAFTDMRRI